MNKLITNKVIQLSMVGYLFMWVIILTLNNQNCQHKELMGDVNQDGKLSISDMAMIKSHILGNSELTFEQMDLADMNNDTHIDVVDIMEIRRIILNKGE